MLSWSSQNAGLTADIGAIAQGHGETGIPFGTELLRFAEAVAGWDDQALDVARQRLVDVAGEAFMVDAAAVAANFEMMTRVADGTGARFPDEVRATRAEEAGKLGIDGLTSRR